MTRRKVGLRIALAFGAVAVVLTAGGLTGPTSAGVPTTSATDADFRLLADAEAPSLQLEGTEIDYLPPLTIAAGEDADGVPLLLVSDPLGSEFGFALVAGETFVISQSALQGVGDVLDLGEVTSAILLGDGVNEQSAVDFLYEGMIGGHSGAPNLTFATGSTVNDHEGGPINLARSGLAHFGGALGPAVAAAVNGTTYFGRYSSRWGREPEPGDDFFGALFKIGSARWGDTEKLTHQFLLPQGSHPGHPLQLKAAGVELPVGLLLAAFDGTGSPVLEIVEGVGAEEVDPAACGGLPWACVDEAWQVSTTLTGFDGAVVGGSVRVAAHSSEAGRTGFCQQSCIAVSVPGDGPTSAVWLIDEEYPREALVEVTEDAAWAARIGEIPNGERGVDVSLGDMNGDGVLDLAIGVAGSDTEDGLSTAGEEIGDAGEVYVILGPLTGGSLADLVDARYVGSQARQLFGGSVLLTDVNADGLDDLLVSARRFASNRASQGGVFVFLSGEAVAEPPVEEPPVEEPGDEPGDGDAPTDVLAVNAGGQFLFWSLGPGSVASNWFSSVKIAWLFDRVRIVWTSYVPALGVVDFALVDGAVLWVVSPIAQDLSTGG